jgi:hypothetical protein
MMTSQGFPTQLSDWLWIPHAETPQVIYVTTLTKIVMEGEVTMKTKATSGFHIQGFSTHTFFACRNAYRSSCKVPIIVV